MKVRNRGTYRQPHREAQAIHREVEVEEVKIRYKAKRGQKTSTVKKIQETLYKLDYTSQLVTSYYGDITFNNIAYFQIVNGLTVTGWVDNETYKLLTAVIDTPVPEQIELKEKESHGGNIGHCLLTSYVKHCII